MDFDGSIVVLTGAVIGVVYFCGSETDVEVVGGILCSVDVAIVIVGLLMCVSWF